MIAGPKALLAAAYERGEKPLFVDVAPNGVDELWALADVAMVVPVIPADAPPVLESALRLRRETMFAGRCPECEATVEVESVVEADPATPDIAAATFPHQRRCAAHDAHVERLLKSYWERRGGRPDEHRFEHAQARVRERMAAIKTGGIEMKAVADSDRAETMLDELLTPEHVRTACAHLRSDPVQPWNVLIAEGVWRCDACQAYEEARLRKEGPRFDPIEEYTCDLCRRYAPKTLGPMVLRLDTFVMRGGVCKRCVDGVQTRSSQEERHG